MMNKPFLRPNTPPPTPGQPERKPKLSMGQRVKAVGKSSGFEVEGTFDGVFSVEVADAKGRPKMQTMFWVKDDGGDRWRFLPWEVTKVD